MYNVPKIVDIIVQMYNLYPLQDVDTINVCNVNLTKAHNLIKLVKTYSVNSVRFNSTHILLNGEMLALEELSTEHEFNLRLILNEDEFCMYKIAVEVKQYITLPEKQYINANIEYINNNY